ncbi:MAG: phytanoyl-CoA dioxygenase family protein [Cyanobacteriota bacterium]
MLKQEGYFVYPELLESDRLQMIRAWIALINKNRPISIALEPEFESSDESLPPLRKIRRLFWYDPSFWISILSGSALLDLARGLVGDQVNLILHAAFLKPPLVGGATAAHQDQALWGIDYPGAISVWVALDSAQPVNGCLELYPGSHLSGLISHALDSPDAWHPSVDQTPFPIMAKALPLTPGDAIVWHRYMVHRSGENRSNDPRWGVVFVFADQSQNGFDAFDRFPLMLLPNPNASIGAHA